LIFLHCDRFAVGVEVVEIGSDDPLERSVSEIASNPNLDDLGVEGPDKAGHGESSVGHQREIVREVSPRARSDHDAADSEARVQLSVGQILDRSEDA
jgi:hypothetical protein